MGVLRLDLCLILESALVGVLATATREGENRTGEAGMCLVTGVWGDSSNCFCGVVMVVEAGAGSSGDIPFTGVF